MSYIISGLNVELPPRAQRPREPGRPTPRQALNSPELATRMLRPRSPKDPGAAAPHLARVRALKLQQAAFERRLGTIKRAKAAAKSEMEKLALAKEESGLIGKVKSLAGQANKEALAAIEKGAAPDDVKAVAAESSTNTSVTPVVESATAALQPDGSVKVGADAAIVAVPVTSDPGSSTAAPAPSLYPVSNTAITVPLMVAGGVVGLFGLYKLMKRSS